jgi:hypothetical protein
VTKANPNNPHQIGFRTVNRPLKKKYVYGWSDAEVDAQKILGPQGVIRFVRTDPYKTRCKVGVLFEEDGITKFGVVGWGKDWPSALKDAKVRVAEANAEAEADGND